MQTLDILPDFEFNSKLQHVLSADRPTEQAPTVIDDDAFDDVINTTSVVIMSYEMLQDPHNVVGQVGASITIILIIVGVLGNLQVLVLIARCRHLHRSYNILIASLAFTDLMFNLFMMPYYADSYVHRRWRFSRQMCQFNTYFGSMILMSSGLHIGLIAINR